MRGAPRLAAFVALAALSALGACADVDVPVAPDVRALREGYAPATARLDEQTARFVRTASGDAAAYAALEGLDVVPATVRTVASDEGAAIGVPDPEQVGDGYFELALRCPGEGRPWGDPPAADGGSLRFVATLSARGVDPVVWGAFDDCRFEGEVAREALPVRVDGDLRMSLGDAPIAFARLATIGDALVEVAGTLAVGDLLLDGRLDFRLLLGGGLLTRVDLPDGGHVFLFVGDRGNVFGVRDADGFWTCDFEGGVCVGPGGQQLFF